MIMMILEIIEKISLYCGEGTSDKTYHMQLCRVPAGFVVRIQHGRRIDDVETEDKSASGLQKLIKPDAGPTSYAEAKKLFDGKVKEKMDRKRYDLYQQGHVINTEASIYHPTGETIENAAQIALVEKARLCPTGTGYLPQLLNPTTLGGCLEMIADRSYYASPKADGERFMLGLRGGQTVASNRRGEGIPVPGVIEIAFTEFLEAAGQQSGFCLDGERIGNVFYVFDLLEYEGRALSPRAGVTQQPVPYFIRARLLERVFKLYGQFLSEKGRTAQPPIRLLPIARTREEKEKLYRDLVASSAEGIVFTHVQSELKPGKPSTGGTRFKYKLQKEADCLVRTTNRRSFECFVYQEQRPISVGFVASGITAGIFSELQERERQGLETVAVVRYLYATGTAEKGGKLFQATFKHFRDDKLPEECLASQLEVTNPNALEEVRVEAA
jgi:ATP-dependent DNA ligase